MKYTAKHEIYYREVVLRNNNWVQVEPKMITELGFPLCDHQAIMEFVTKKQVINFDPLNPSIYSDHYRIAPYEWSYTQTLACVKRSKYSSSDITDGSVIITKDYVDDMLTIWEDMRKKPGLQGNTNMKFIFMYTDCYYEFDATWLLGFIKRNEECITKTRAFYNPNTGKKGNNTVYTIPMKEGCRFDYKATTKEQRDELYTKYGVYDMIDKPADKVTVKPSVISPLI